MPRGGGVFNWRRPAVMSVTTLVLLAAGGALSYQHGLVRLAYPSVEAFPVWGIDVSHYQGAVDWERVSTDDIRFAYIKASEGGDWRDPFYATNMDGAQANGIRVGAYHFFTLCRRGSEQAQNFLALLPPKIDLPPVIDLEYGGNCAARPSREEFERELSAFINAIASERGTVPVFYATEDFYTDYLAGGLFASSPLWVRDIVGGLSWPNEGRLVFRQFANNGRVDGIAGPVDLNHFMGSLEEFEAVFPRQQ